VSNRPGVGLGVFIINEQNKILLAKRKGAHGEETWSIPGGHLEFGETLEECAIREIYEETGLHVANPQFVGLTNDVFAQDNKHSISIFMKAPYPAGQQIINREPDKNGQGQWFDLAHLPENLFMPLESFMNQKGYGLSRLDSKGASSVEPCDLMPPKIFRAKTNA
jgi:8-oxo-dGTP diphosphatase